MGLTRLAIYRPVAILMLVGAFIVLGVIGFFQLPAELNPNVDLPIITIRTSYTGTNPNEMETLITKPIEDSIAGVSGIQQLTSTSQEGLSFIRVQLYFGTDIDAAASDIIQKVDSIRSVLPVAASSPSVVKADVNAQPILNIAMQSPTMTQEQLQSLATNLVQPALEQGTDVGQVTVSTVSTREIHVALHPDRLAALGVTIPQIVSALGAANVNVSSGFVQTNQQYFDVRMIGEFASVDEIRNLRITIPSASGTNTNGQAASTPISFNLSEVADVIDSGQEKTTESQFNGQPAVTINIVKTTDGNTLAAVKSCLAELNSIKIDLPPDVKFTVTFDQSKQVSDNLSDVVASLFLGAVLAVLVVYMFLHNVRGTMIVAIAIPTSMIATFLPLWALGFSLNTFTLLGLSLAVGILVDDSIVVLENINRHLALGEEPTVAAITGRTEIGLAALVLTSVDLVVFLPIGFMGGIIGQFFRSFGVTVAIATLFSLFVSFTLTPMLAARWYRKGEILEAENPFAVGFDKVFAWVEKRYEAVLGWSIRHPWIVVLSANIVVWVVLILVGGQLGFRFAPDQDQGLDTVVIKAPSGSSVYYTLGIADQIEKIIHKTPDLNHDVKFISTQIGSAGAGQNLNGTQFGHVDLTLYDQKSVLDTLAFWNHPHLRSRSDVAIALELRKLTHHIVGAKIIASNVNGGGGGSGSGPPLQINLTGPDLEKLYDASQKVFALAASTPGVYNVDSSFQNSQPEIDVRLDRTKAPDYNLSLNTVATALAASVGGDISVMYRDPTDGQQYNVRIQLKKNARNNLQSISNIVVGFSNGKPIMLTDVAQVTLGTGPVKIDRLNRQRTIAITGYLLPGYSVGKVGLEVNQKIQALHLQQVLATAGGENQNIQNNVGYLVTAFVLGLILTYMLMAALFNNVVYPLAIMLSVPQAWAGGVIAMFFASETLNEIALIGFVLLNAIVNKNAILLVDYTNTLRARGLTRTDALQTAGPIRLRPILMTTFTIIVSTLPTALALGRGAQFRQSLGVVVEGGIIVSLLLTLVVVPSAYVLYDDLSEWYKRKQREGREKWDREHPLGPDGKRRRLGTTGSNGTGGNGSNGSSSNGHKINNEVDRLLTDTSRKDKNPTRN